MKYDTNYHSPIMVNEIKEYLNLKPNGIYLDGTLGGGGHSEMILEASSPSGKLVSIDKDDDALKYASKRLERFGDRFTAVKSDYLYASEELDNLNIEKIDGALFDLGVSSFQLDNFERGFSYRSNDARLDMRMDKSQLLTAFDVVNGYSEKDLRIIFRKYGEEKFSSRIAKNIVIKRERKEIQTCGELVDIVRTSVPEKVKRQGHPAKRIFQAIRIEVNGELVDLEKSMTKIIDKLNVGGRLCVITFHSLEDRIIKNTFKYLELDCICDKSLPICVCDKMQEIKILTRKPIISSELEMNRNPRARSAKLRVIEKIVPRHDGKVISI